MSAAIVGGPPAIRSGARYSAFSAVGPSRPKPSIVTLGAVESCSRMLALVRLPWIRPVACACASALPASAAMATAAALGSLPLCKRLRSVVVEMANSAISRFPGTRGLVEIRLHSVPATCNRITLSLVGGLTIYEPGADFAFIVLSACPILSRSLRKGEESNRPSLLPKRRHGNGNTVDRRSNSYSALTGVWWHGADIVRGWTLGCPKHVSQHARGCSGSRWSNGLNKAASRIFQRGAEVLAFRNRLVAVSNEQAASKFGGRQRRNGRSKIGFAVHMFQPVALSGSSACGLLVRDQRVAIIEHWIGGSEPDRCGHLIDANQETITCPQVDGQAGGRIAPRGVVR